MQNLYQLSADRPLVTGVPWFPDVERERLQEDLSRILVDRLSMGPLVASFQEQFSKYCGVSSGICFPSCTAALEASLVACGIKPGDEVLVPAQTFVATAMAVWNVGARPVFTEVEHLTFSMDFADAKSRITDRTRGAIVVHFGGHISPGLPAFVSELRAKGMFVIEDAAHAPGAELNGDRAGSFGDVGCFSFYPTKIMTTGEGGMAVTSNQTLADILLSLQNRGKDMKASAEQYVIPGRNNRFTEIAAAMGLSQLRCLPDFLKSRRSVAAEYNKTLPSSVSPMIPVAGEKPAYWRYTVLLNQEKNRGQIKDQLSTAGISVDWAYEPPVHLQPVFINLLGNKPGMLPRTEELMRRHLCLPINSRMIPDDAAYVSGELDTAVREIS